MGTLIMPNTEVTKQRMHIKTNSDASEMRLKPGDWPATILHEGNVFKRNHCKRSSMSGEIMWFDYHSNIQEHFWVLRIWND